MNRNINRKEHIRHTSFLLIQPSCSRQYPNKQNIQKQDNIQDFLLLGGFIDYLQQEGFAVGIDTHLQVKRLLSKLEGEGIGEERLQQLLSPIFAKSEEEQVLFRRAFERYFRQFDQQSKVGYRSNIGQNRLEI